MFLKILLIILFIIFVLPLILALMGIGVGFKMLNRFKKDLGSEQTSYGSQSKSSQTGDYGRRGQSTRGASGAGHGKIISDDEGEYVEFEETPRK